MNVFKYIDYNRITAGWALTFRPLVFLLVLYPFLTTGQLWDQSFGQNGRQIINVDQVNEASSLLVLPGDTLLVLGYTGHSDSLNFDMDILVACLDRQGQLVSGFGQNGLASMD